MRRITVHAVTMSLGLALMLAHAPARSSEVVRLARLLITGKRLSPERLEPVAPEQAKPPAELARSTPHGGESRPTTTAQAPAGQDVPPRGSTPSRGVVSFF